VFQGRIKGFLGPRYFSSLGPLGDSKIIVGTIPGLMEGGIQGNKDSANFIFYILTAPLARHKTEKCTLLTHFQLHRQAYSGILI
jgi:hypothetical protein